MTTKKTILDDWSVKDLEDGSSLTVTVVNYPELGHQSLPGLQVLCMGTILNYEPGIVERWAYQASKVGVEEYLIEDNSWLMHDDRFVKNYLILGSPLKMKVSVKTRTSQIVSREYDLPFDV
ncbi:hypothetical protein [Salmonirosea aquatica]|uniref:Uncharacterized protein n=1 Tax=Salmonirosea aquatica TaxID=2654236 RepID=A0A7C9BGG9_9BACT|nr:hypothetical protein [Cytophagaceae bacterium SJW1-29]